MATNKEYLNFILVQLSLLDGITYKQMMGEYLIYYNGKLTAYLCDDRLLVKPTKAALAFIENHIFEPPYEGAKDMLLVECVDDKEYLAKLFNAISAGLSNGIAIRLEKKNEERIVETLVRDAFWNVYRPGASEHYILHLLRKDPNFVNKLNFVIEKDHEIIGQTTFVKSVIKSDTGSEIPTLTLGPICIANKYKKQGYGKILLDYAFEKAGEQGFGAVLFEGNIDFYGKCGCVKASTYGIRYDGMPEGEEADYFLCKILKDGYLDNVSGVYAAPKVYYVDDSDVEAFDRQFEPKQKLKLPGQLF